MNQGAVAGIVVGAVIIVLIFAMMAGSGSSSGGSKKDKFLKNKLGYLGLIIIILVALYIGGAVNSMFNYKL